MPNLLTGRTVPLPKSPTAGERFLTAVEQAIARVQRKCPDCLVNVDVGVDEVPSQPAMWSSLAEHGVIPLAVAVEAEPNRPARIVIFRRPLEHRAVDDDDLRQIVYRTLVEQLSTLTGRAAFDIDDEADGW